MRKSDKTTPEQEAIIAEYLLGDTIYHKLRANMDTTSCSIPLLT